MKYQASLQWLHAIKIYTVVLQQISNLPTKIPIIIMQWEKENILKAKLMIKEKMRVKSDLTL
jgi:hypothetical protein